MSAHVTFVGSGDAFAGGGRFQACLLLDGGAEPLLLDCGASALIALKRMGIDPAGIGYVALSHLHGDHFAGLPWLILDGQFGGRSMPLVVAGPRGTQARVNQAFEALYPGASTAERAFETAFVEYASRVSFTHGPAQITAYPVEHSAGTEPHALRVEYAGRVIAYSGDTEWTGTLIDVAAGADLFICECNFVAKKGPGHLDYETLMEKRSQLTCERIVLTHMSEDMLARVGEIELEAASDGAVIDI